MTDKQTYKDRLRSMAPAGGNSEYSQKPEAEGEDGEGSGGAFGYLRGLRDHASSVEFRFRDGSSIWFPYSWLGPWQYNPSEGLLLKFSGDLVYLVLIRGSNLDLPLKDGAANLTTGGLQRHRVLWIREMMKEDIQQVGEKGPTIDVIEVAQFESPAEVRAWISKHTPAFISRGQ